MLKNERPWLNSQSIQSLAFNIFPFYYAAMKSNNRIVFFLVLVAALGYFVDIYDLILFSVVRVPSLKELGLADQALLDQGVSA